MPSRSACGLVSFISGWFHLFGRELAGLNFLVWKQAGSISVGSDSGDVAFSTNSALPNVKALPRPWLARGVRQHSS